MTREQLIGGVADYIDKWCTGGTENDWIAAEMIVGMFEAVLGDRVDFAAVFPKGEK